MKMFHVGPQGYVEAGPIPHRPLRGQWEYFLSDNASLKYCFLEASARFASALRAENSISSWRCLLQINLPGRKK